MDTTNNYTKLRESIIASSSNLIEEEFESDEILTNTYSICDGFEEDCQELIDNFLKKDSIRYKVFLKQWKESKFDTVFCGRPTIAELWEFCEGALNIAAKFLLYSNTEDSYHRCIAGLYLVYMIHKYDDITKKAKVRVLPSSVNILRDLLEHSRANDHLDALYILSAMLRDGVFRFVATENEHGIGLPFRKDEEKKKRKINHSHTNLMARYSLDDALGDLTENFKIYHSCKSELSGIDKVNPPKELDYVDPNFTEKLIDSLKNLDHDLKTLYDKQQETSQSLTRKRISLPEIRRKKNSQRTKNLDCKTDTQLSEHLIEEYNNDDADDLDSKNSKVIWDKCLENLNNTENSTIDNSNCT